MRKEKGKILITLTEWLDAGLSYDQYKNDRRRGYLQTLNRGGYGREAEIIWQSIARDDRKEAIIKAVGGDPEKICSNYTFAGMIQPDPKAQDFFNEYTLSDGRNLSIEKQLEYITNAQILNALAHSLADMRGTQGALGSGGGIKATLTTSVRNLNKLEYPHSLPTNERRLFDLLKRYRQDGCEVLISRKFSNINATKVGDDDTKVSIITELISDFRNLDNAQVARLYNTVAEPVGWKKISPSTVGAWRKKLDLASYAGRQGETAFRNSRTMQVKRTAPSCPLYMWTADGWDVELLYQATSTDRQGRNTTTYHNRLTVVVVLDPCEKYPIGYAVGDHENTELIKEALRNAANHTAELFGQRHRAHQLQTDHYAIKSLTPLYTVMADKHTPARVKNAKAKIVEPYFRHLNKTYCQFMPNWSGFGLTSKKDNQPNIDYINRYRHSFPDRAGCMMQIQRIIELEREQKREKFMKQWEATPAENRLLLQPEKYLLYFGASTERKNLLQGSGLHPTIGGVVRDYDCFDMQFRQHYGVQWTVLYDPADMSQAMAVNDDGTLRFMLEEKYVQPMALRDRKEGDAAQLAKVRGFNELLEATITEQRCISGEKTRAFFEENPQLASTLTKLVLVDSRGQHKDARNRSRMLKEAVNVDAVTPVRIPELVTVEADDTDTNIYDLY